MKEKIVIRGELDFYPSAEKAFAMLLTRYKRVCLCFGAKMTAETAEGSARGSHGSSQKKKKAISKLITIHSTQSGMQLTILLTGDLLSKL